MELTFNVPKLDQFAAVLERLGDTLMREVVGPAVYTQAQLAMTKIKQHDVPVDTGTLRSTGQVEQPTYTGNEVRVAMGFGGPSATYALIVHEKVENKHPVGRAKFLEAPLNEGMNEFADALAKRIRADLERRMV